MDEDAPPEQPGSQLADAISRVHAWHGSPHQFEQFSREKIGTGEGGAAYGRGTAYLAEARQVAEEYRKNLSRGGHLGAFIDHPDGTFIYKNDSLEDMTPHMRALAMTAHADGDAQSAAEMAEYNATSLPYLKNPKAPNPWQDTANLLRSNRSVYDGTQWQEPGHLYHVEINAHPDEFLHWDKQLNEQSPQVRAALQKIMPTPSAEQVSAAQQAENAAQNHYMHTFDNYQGPKRAWHISQAHDAAVAAITNRQDMENIARGEITGEDIYQRLVDQSKARSSARPNYIDLRGGDPHKQFASDTLEQAGIPGIRYMDQWSRDQKPRDEIEADLADWQDEHARLRGQDPTTFEGGPRGHQTALRVAEERIALHQRDLRNWKPPTHNYVVFSPDRLRIMKRYGLASAGLSGGT